MLTTQQFYIIESQKSKHSKIHGYEIIKDFGLSTDDYIVFASGAMVAHGLMDKNEDIDMYIKPSKFKLLVKNGKLKKQCQCQFLYIEKFRVHEAEISLIIISSADFCSYS